MTPEEARKQLKHLFLHARFADGERFARQVRDDAVCKQNPELAADVAFRLGQCLLEQLRYQDAWDAFADALGDRTELFGGNHLRTAQARAWLASVSWSLERHAETRALSERAKSAVPATPAEDERLVAADTLRAIGYVETQLKQKSACETLRRSLELIEMAGDADELEVASICVGLGMAEEFAKRHDRAEKLYQRALDIRLRLLEDTNPLVAYCRNHLAISRMLQGGPKQARELVDASIAGLEAANADQRLTASSLSTRATIAALEDDHVTAVETLEKAMIMTGGNDADTPEVAQTLIMLGLVQLGFEKPDLAEPHLRRAVKILLPYHQTRLDVLFNAFNNTLMALNAQRKFKDIITFVEPILQKLQNEAIVDQGLLAAVTAGLSTGHYGLKKYAKAEKLLRRALSIAEAGLGKDARELDPILYNMACLLDEMGRTIEARAYARRREELLAKYN